MNLRQAAEQALKYFEDAHGLEDAEVAIKEALSQALAQPEREWVGLDSEIPGLGLVTEEFYNGMIVAEDILREKNT